MTEQPKLLSTPFGVACTNCLPPTPIGSERQCRSHLKTCWTLTDEDGRANAAHVFRVAEASSKRMAGTNLSEFLLPGTHHQLQCSNCNKKWEKRRAALAHIKRSKDGCQIINLMDRAFRKTTCGRLVDPGKLSEVAMSMSKRPPESIFGPLPGIGGPPLPSFGNILEVLKPFVRVDEKADVYSDFFAPLVGEGGCGFEHTVRGLLSAIGHPKALPLPLDDNVSYIQSLAMVWLMDFAPVQIPKIPGNIRARILVFPGQQIDDDKYNTTFNLRYKIDTLLDELLPLIRYAWHRGVLSWVRDEILHVGRNDNVHLRSALVPRILHHLIVEEPTSYSVDPLVVRFCVARCFKIGKDKKLEMVACAQSGSRMASVLHVLRAGVLSVIWYMGGPGLRERATGMATEARDCTVVNTLSPFVHRLRAMNKEKPRSYQHFVLENLDIVASGLTFKAVHWMSIIPRTEEYCKNLLALLLDGISWREFLRADSISVEYKPDSLQLEIIGSQWSQDSVKLKRDYNSSDLDRLTSGVESAFHAFGGGSTRKEEVVRLHASEVVYQNSAVYYLSQTIKRFNCLQNHKRMVDHKLPQAMGRIVLLFRTIVLSFDSFNKESFGPFRTDRSHWMTDAVKELYDLPRKPTALQVRHLYASVANCAFPDDETNDLSTAQKIAAEKFGHSRMTHKMSYRSDTVGGQEHFYSRWHQVLGDSASKCGDDDLTIPLHLLSSSLQLLCGHGAKWRCQGQEQMVQYAANGNSRHCHISLPCGYGKSLSWLCPIQACLSFGLTERSYLVVLPTKFLAQQLSYQAEMKLGLFGDRVGLVLGSDVGDEGHEWFSQQADNSKLLIMATIDAVHRIYESCGSSGFDRFHKIILDEIHAVLQEDSLRRAYDIQANLCKVGVPILTLSGSLHPRVSGSLHAGYLGLARDVYFGNMDVVREGDPVGDEFTLEVIETSHPTVQAIKTIRKYSLQQPRHSVHVICDTIANCETVHRVLEKASISARLVTGKIPSKQQGEIAGAWYSGEFKVLVSTTAAILGNENSRCRLIVVVGLIYSVTNLVQAIGRLRPEQRGSDARVMVFFRKESNESILEMRARAEARQLVLKSKKMIDENSAEQHKAAFSKESLYILLEDDSRCYLTRIRLLYGVNGGLKCGRCTACSPNVVQLAAAAAVDQDAQALVTKSIAENHLLDMGSRCLLCSERVCDGESCLPPGRCYNCHGPHRKSACTVRTSTIVEGYSCYYCLDLWARIGAHESSGCPLKRRLKRFMFHLYWTRYHGTSTVHSFLAHSCASVSNLHSILGGWDGQLPGNGRSRLKIIKGSQVSDEHPYAPLLPPDTVDTKYIGAVPGEVITLSNVDQARNYYNNLIQSRQYQQSHRRFLQGSLYTQVLGSPLILQAQPGQIINLDLGSSNGIVQVGLCEDYNVTSSILQLSKLLSRFEGNTSRKGKGDVGKMWAMGYKSRRTGLLYNITQNPVISRAMVPVSSFVSKYMKEYYPSLYQDMRHALLSDPPPGLLIDEMGGEEASGSAMMLTRGYANASHYDKRDSSLSFGMWVEDEIGDARDWFFVLPNVMVAGQHGVLIRLSHGVTISWDGPLVRHCTSLCKKSDTNEVTGFMMGVQG